MQQKNIKGIKGDVSAPKNKWIVRGGSYSGNLAAWMRLEYPDLVYAAVSSSAPVQAQYNFYQYFDPIIQYGPPRCVKALHDIVERIDQFFASHPSDTQKTQFKAGFGVEDSTPDNEFADSKTKKKNCPNREWSGFKYTAPSPAFRSLLFNPS
jgi:pimeloyl-ACP methyl ester carboxylesterase